MCQLFVHGDVDLVIPEGTQTGKKFRLRGKGLQAYVVVPWRSICICQCRPPQLV